MASSTGVNGSGQGNTTAALHALPSKYTLVLIDGVRPPPAAINNSFGGGFAAAIQAIPLDAVERVEILLDGATAVYGSDAVAGVVNFILKKNTTEGNAYAQYTWPTKGDAQSVNAGVSKGWGDLAKDGWNVMGTFSYAHQSKLQATDRKVSKQGAYFPFTHNGVNYIFNNATENTEPGNLIFQAVPASNPAAAPTPYSINPYYRQNGNCQNPALVISGSDRHGVARGRRRILPLQLRRHRAGRAPVGHGQLRRQGLHEARRQRDRMAHGQPVAFRDDPAICSAGAAFWPQYHDADSDSVQQVCPAVSGLPTTCLS